MKTEQQVREMLENKQKDIDSLQVKTTEYNQINDRIMFDHYDREYAKAVAQYNILLEVLI